MVKVVMLCSLNDLETYKKYYENVLNGNIKPFEDKLINELSIHKNGQDGTDYSYLRKLMSFKDSPSYIKCRYLIQFMSEDYKVCDGYLDCFDKEVFHTWIENKDKVYDAKFVGIWPKELYYEVMKPRIVKELDLNKDKEFLSLKEKTIEIEKQNEEFGYIDWYGYMKNNTINTRGFIEPMRIKKFKNE